jgi:transposase InsO family protein
VKKAVQRRADHCGSEGSRGRRKGAGAVSQAWDLGRDVAKLKRIVADQALDNAALKDLLGRKPVSGTTTHGAQEKRKRIGLVERLVVPAAQTPNQSWSMDYVADGLIDGRKLRALTVVDDFTRECLAIEVDTSLPGSRVVAVLERLRDSSWLARVDHGGPWAGVRGPGARRVGLQAWGSPGLHPPWQARLQLLHRELQRTLA